MHSILGSRVLSIAKAKSRHRGVGRCRGGNDAASTAGGYEEVLMKIVVSLWLGVVVGACGILATGCEASPDGKEWVSAANASEQVASTSQAVLAGAQKLCSGVVASNF